MCYYLCVVYAVICCWICNIPEMTNSRMKNGLVVGHGGRAGPGRRGTGRVRDPGHDSSVVCFDPGRGYTNPQM